MKVKEWIEKNNRKEFETNDFDTMCSAGWYDWFCDETELLSRLQKMSEIIRELTNQNILENYDLRLYNRCPIDYPLYDEISFIPDDQMGRVISIKIDCPYSDKKYLFETWSISEGIKQKYKTDTKEKMITYINNFK